MEGLGVEVGYMCCLWRAHHLPKDRQYGCHGCYTRPYATLTHSATPADDQKDPSHSVSFGHPAPHPCYGTYCWGCHTASLWHCFLILRVTVPCAQRPAHLCGPGTPFWFQSLVGVLHPSRGTIALVPGCHQMCVGAAPPLQPSISQCFTPCLTATKSATGTREGEREGRQAEKPTTEKTSCQGQQKNKRTISSRYCTPAAPPPPPPPGTCPAHPSSLPCLSCALCTTQY